MLLARQKATRISVTIGHDCNICYKNFSSNRTQGRRSEFEIYPQTITTVCLLGQVFFRQDRYEEAEALHRQTLKGRQKVTGPQHPRTLDSAAFLLQVLIEQTKCEEAEELSRRALEGKEKVLRKNHRDTLDNLYRLAYLLDRLRPYDEALPLYQKVFLSCTETFGTSHSLTQACLDGQSFV